ncbi:GNAT family N-acetyltransferase [Alkalibacillus aidingensis]|uniref:GNAT family N-acetyltransferase n=1 Tax=Alkalibacillus aidingensis TaxID=2747607 RepID=UPI00166138B1|nr:GNAT family N-acetyltransferase [Alkalibacillus aidingensis]
MIRPFEKGDEAQLNRLFKHVFDKDRSIEEFEWKYLKHPVKNNPWILVYEEDGAILGSIALWVLDAYVKGEERQIALRCDTMVSPEARGKGVYRQLNEAMLERAKQDGIVYLYGFPSEQAKGPLMKQTGGKHLGEVSRMVAIYEPVSILSGKLPLLKPFRLVDRIYRRRQTKVNRKFKSDIVEISLVDVFDQRVDELCEQTRNLSPVLVKRTKDYLNWRYAEHPIHDYQILIAEKAGELIGYTILKTEPKNGFKAGAIVDMIALPDDEEVWKALAHQSVKQLSDCALIQAWTIPETMFAQTLEKAGFFEKDQPMPLVGNLLEEQRKSIHHMNAFYITQGDVDSF